MFHCGNGCAHGGCGACCGSCGSCGGDTLFLTGGELALLRRFAEVPFLPLWWDPGAERPTDPADPTAEGSASVAGLSAKRLIRADRALPLAGYDYGPVPEAASRGSMALTALGQQALEYLEVCGVDGETDNA
ncbi:MAG: hypothetical protein Q4C53_06880 [Clostridia bacterium]|nr:hypothetical protein [Clostridia bacterium]